MDYAIPAPSDEQHATQWRADVERNQRLQQEQALARLEGTQDLATFRL